MNGKMTKRLRLGTVSRKEHRKAKAAYAHGNQGQDPKPLKERTHYNLAPRRPTWPETLDQNLQSRPVIVMSPLRRYLKETLMSPKERRRRRGNMPSWPKHALDAAAANL